MREERQAIEDCTCELCFGAIKEGEKYYAQLVDGEDDFVFHTHCHDVAEKMGMYAGGFHMVDISN